MTEKTTYTVRWTWHARRSKHGTIVREAIEAPDDLPDGVPTWATRREAVEAMRREAEEARRW